MTHPQTIDTDAAEIKEGASLKAALCVAVCLAAVAVSGVAVIARQTAQEADDNRITDVYLGRAGTSAMGAFNHAGLNCQIEFGVDTVIVEHKNANTEFFPAYVGEAMFVFEGLCHIKNSTIHNDQKYVKWVFAGAHKNLSATLKGIKL